MQELGGFLTPASGLALDDDGLVARKLGGPGRELVLRNEVAVEVGKLELPRLADIENKGIFARVSAAFELMDGDLVDAVLLGQGFSFHLRFRGGLLRARDAAELVVVDQLGHRRVGAAGGAVGIFAQLELAKPGTQGVHQQQAAN